VLSQATQAATKQTLKTFTRPFKQNGWTKGQWHVRPGSSPLVDCCLTTSQPNLVDEPLPRREG
jgi:hypothetical protein